MCIMHINQSTKKVRNAHDECAKGCHRHGYTSHHENPVEHLAREERAARLKKARVRVDLGAYRKLAQKFGWNENTYKAHEQCKNGFGLTDARNYAEAFKVSLPWLFFGEGSPDGTDAVPIQTTDFPLVSRVSAAPLANNQASRPLTTSPRLQR